MIDRERVLAKLDEMDGYLREFESILLHSLEEYRHTEKRRACERLLQVSVECVIDVCNLLVASLRSGLPAEESDLFWNILVHDYGRVLDEVVFEVVSTKRGDFAGFRREVLDALARR